MTAIGFEHNKWLLLLGLLCLSLIAHGVHAGEPSVIELKDGSIISGEVVSFDGSTWIIESASMGRLKIEAAKVVSIQSKKTGSQAPDGGRSAGNQANMAEIQAMQQSIMTNEALMSMIMGLQNDPDIQAILQDPEIMKAVEAGDINALLANPKFRKLMENRDIKAITREALKE
jgi:hypothetical protein